MKSNSVIIPVASGKGGVGKSLLTANLAVALANAGFSTIVIDLDLGGSNLYSYLGLENKHPGIGDYFSSKKGKLTDYLVQTDYPNLQFLPGECRMTFMANLPYAQKVKLIREIKNIQAEYILLDLGAGTSFNTLDYFDLSTNGIVITTFEKPSILNTLSFIKNFIFRMVHKDVRKNHPVLSSINELYKTSAESNPVTISSVMGVIENMDSALASNITDKYKQYHPRIIFNMAEHPDNLDVSSSLEKSIKKNLSLDLWFFGLIYLDKLVETSTKNNQVLISKHPESIATKGINDIARRIVKYNDNFMNNSNELLQNDSKEKFELWGL